MPASPKIQITLSKLLVVEGRDEENFFSAALTTHLGIANVQVLPIGGKTLLTGNLKLLVNDSAFGTVQTLAVVRDADTMTQGSTTTAAAAAFASVCGSLTAAGLGHCCPAQHGQFGGGSPRVGVFILPDGTADGMLETLCMSAVSGNAEYACITDFFACCKQHGLVPNNLHKGQAHAWLASRPEPDKRVGEAALAGYWPFSSPAFQPLWTFLNAI